MPEPRYASPKSSVNIPDDMATPITPAPPGRWIPGEVGIWVFIFTDLTVFGMYFATFFHERNRNPAAFAHGTAQLSPFVGALNTALLLTASLFVALAVQALRAGRVTPARNYLLSTGLCGLAFVVNKFFEWHRELTAGYGPHHDNFFQLYYMLTGLHLLHVLIAVVLVSYLWRMAGTATAPLSPRRTRFLENSANYWHLVDAIWLVLFVIFYLVR
jgi:nitric oxide reductase NorE protein